MGKRELVGWFFVFLMSRDCCCSFPVPRVCLQFVTVVFPLTIFYCSGLRLNCKTVGQATDSMTIGT